MKKQLAMGTLAAAVLSVTAPALASDVISANVGVVSDYIWRGISQSDNQIAIQGGFDYKHDSGAYAGLWMSSLSAWYYDGADYADAEMDMYVGYGLALTDDVSLDLRYTSYQYIAAKDLNFDELHVGLSAYGATAAVDYADNREDGNSTTLHYVVGYGTTLSGLGFSANYGIYDLKDDVIGNDDSYAYWNLGINKELGGVTLGLSYNDTDISDTDCAAAFGYLANDGDHICGEVFVVSATKSF